MLIVEKIEYSTNYLRAIEWFEEYLSEVVLMTNLIEKSPNFLYYWYKNDGVVLQYDIKYKHFFVYYANIWQVFKLNFGLNNMEIKQLTASMLKQHTKQEVVTTEYLL